jgi:nucleotide-binding universal stress UspA family protein
MTQVLAALDNTLADRPVVATARRLGELLDADVQPVHVRVDSERTARLVAEAAGLSLIELAGKPIDELVRAAGAEHVVSIVLGARATPGGARPAGSTALAVAARVPKPVVIVPPDTPRPGRLERILVPLEGTSSSSLAPRGVIEMATRAHIDVIVVHVLDEESIPAFTDQPQHEPAAWAQEFLNRYCPGRAETVRFESRVGHCEELIPRAAEETGADLIALGWARELAPGRATVVRAALARARVPVLLVPVVVRSRERVRVADSETS